MSREISANTAYSRLNHVSELIPLIETVGIIEVAVINAMMNKRMFANIRQNFIGGSSRNLAIKLCYLRRVQYIAAD